MATKKTDTPDVSRPTSTEPVARQRSATTESVVDRPPEEAARIAQEVTPSPSERVMGLPDSPSAAETGTGH